MEVWRWVMVSPIRIRKPGLTRVRQGCCELFTEVSNRLLPLPHRDGVERQVEGDHVMDVNLKGVSFTAQEVQRHLSTRGGLEQWFPGGRHRVVLVQLL